MSVDESRSSIPPRVLTPRRAEPAASVRPTRAEVGLGHLRHNLLALARAAGVPIWSVLKADAYGHGAKAVARTLERAGSAGVWIPPAAQCLARTLPRRDGCRPALGCTLTRTACIGPW